MARIVNYKIVHDSSTLDLSEAVSKLLEQGWQPFGNLSTCVSSPDGYVWKYQPMVRYEETVSTPKPELPPGVALVESILPGSRK